VNRKVLIAEDEPSIVASLEFLLGQSDCEVRVARDGEEALRLVESFAPHLVLLDVMMPLKSGLDVCQCIRGNPAWQGIKVMLLSAKGRDADVGRGLAFGADAYLSKPFSTKALLERVRALLAEGA
jgi:two-component system, OmpR family, alkaline phosphatase synthesis response regulator PhoP